MRIAVLSDIHGNLAALDAVLGDIARRGVDATVNLGDILSGPLQPAETADRLMALTQPPERMEASDAYAQARLTERHRAWLASLPATLWLADDLFLCHGTPTSDVQYFLETVEPKGARAADAAEVRARAGDVPAALILCGHTHLPRAHRLDDGRLVVNPGSVGLPAYDDGRPYPHAMEAGSPHARYAIVERGADGAWSVEAITVAYNWETAAATAEARGRPDWAIALRTGRMAA